MYRRVRGALEVFLVHPGGPFYVRKDEGVWTIPKGEYQSGEEPLQAARREFNEETGFVAEGPFVALGEVKQKSGKVVMAWAFEGDCDPKLLKSNLCEIEWPPRSKEKLMIPEIDRGGWFSLEDAKKKLNERQALFLDVLRERVSV
jgi:predicted NUDIX family NTP pyrophosphohydrolase